MPDLELQANNPTFTPLPLDAPDPLPPELARRANDLMAEAHEAQRAIKYSDDHHLFDRHVYKDRLKSARRKAIQEWNAEQMARAAGAPPASE
jgi:hypothetical protein